jgi:glycogen synthase
MVIDVLFVAPEVKGYAQAGGIGDVIKELPLQVKREFGSRKRIAVAVPWFGLIHAKRPDLVNQVQLAARVTYPYMGDVESSNIFHTKMANTNNQVDLFLVQNMKYFELFGNGAVFVPSRIPFEQDAIRFGCFCAALKEFLLLPDVTVRTLHLHDWMMAPLATGIRFGDRHEELRDVAIVSTIHNGSYQGDLHGDSKTAMQVLLPVSSPSAAQLVFDQSRDTGGGINFMQALVKSSNLVTTVSSHYQKELLEYGDRWNFFDGAGPLAPVFRELNERGAFWGIPNGLNYGKQPMIQTQPERRRRFSELLGEIPLREDLPVFSLVGRLVEQKFGLLLAEDERGITLLEHILGKGAMVVVLADGDPSCYWAWRLKELNRSYPNLIFRIAFDPALAEVMGCCSDFFLMLSAGTEPFGIAHLQAQFLGGVVPICHLVGGLRDNTSDACSYRFSRGRDRLETIQRAKFCIDQAVGEFPGPDFERRRRASREKRVGWEAPARTYLRAYARAGENNRLAAHGPEGEALRQAPISGAASKRVKKETPLMSTRFGT